jgi:hypothetical protein
MRWNADQGGLVKKDPVERFVNEDHDRGAHFEQALLTDFGCMRKSGTRYRQMDAAWNHQISDVPADVKRLRHPFNLDFLAILLDAWEWPDVSSCSCLLQAMCAVMVIR